jgi:hypothetical protein
MSAAPDKLLPIQPAYQLPARSEAQRWLVTGLWLEQAVGVLGGNEKESLMERNWHSSLILRASAWRELLIIGAVFSQRVQPCHELRISFPARRLPRSR